MRLRRKGVGIGAGNENNIEKREEELITLRGNGSEFETVDDKGGNENMSGRWKMLK